MMRLRMNTSTKYLIISIALLACGNNAFAQTPVESQARKPTGSWRGDLVFRVRGEGSVKNETSTARWKIDRTVRGTIVLDMPIQGAAIAGSPDKDSTKRYESWIGSKQPIEMHIRDEVIQRGPLFHPKQIRLDTLRLVSPPSPLKAVRNQGEIGSPTLQIDHLSRRFTWKAPRLEAPTEYYFVREFVEGPKDWTSRSPIRNEEVRLGFQAIFELNQPAEWFTISGAFADGQTEIVLSRKFPFAVKLMPGLPAPKLDAEMTLVLRRVP